MNPENKIRAYPENGNCIFACDMGGSFIKAACMNGNGTITGETLMIPSHSDGSPDNILGAWEVTLKILLDTMVANKLNLIGIGVSTPGPFDYIRKMSLMKHKFQSIYGINLENEIKKRIRLPDVPINFIQDANAYLLGEQKFGCARGIENCMCVTLGTGFGIAAMAGGKILSNGRDSCYIAIYRQPWGDGIIEDVVSGRGICAVYNNLAGTKTETSAKDVCEKARQGEMAAIETMNQFGTALGRSIGFHLIHTYAQTLIIGGQISRDLVLFEKSLLAALRKDGYTGPVLPAQYPDDAALYGVTAAVLNPASIY